MHIEKIIYPDGSFYPLLPSDCDPIEKLTYKINSYEDLWFLNQIKDVLDYNNIKCDLIIPCLLDGQADRRFLENSSANLKLICKFLNNMQWNNISIFHPHNPEVVEALINNVKIIDNKTFIKEVLSDIYCNQNNIIRDPGLYYHQKIENLVLLSPDAGAYKWISKLADNLEFTKEVISASKSRKWKDGHSKLTQVLDKQNFEGKDVLIVDDLLIGGSSVINLGNILKTRNVRNIYVAVSHITIKTPRKDLETVFNKIYSTNSKYNKQEYNINPEKLEIINIF